MMNSCNENFVSMVVLSTLILFAIDLKLGMLTSTILFTIFFILFLRNMYKRKENYTALPNPNTYIKYSKDNSCNATVSEDCIKYNSDPFRTKSVVVEGKMKSINNALVGGANPKTVIPPMITRPCYSLGWRDSTMTKPNMINASTNEDLYRSGYLSEPTRKESSEHTNRDVTVENFETDYGKQSWSDAMDASSGYDKKQWIDANFPANLPQAKCERAPIMSGYNTNLFTQTIQPGVLYKNDIIEPINKNIGISFQQQFLPRTYKKLPGDVLEIEDHNPEFAPAPEDIIEPVIEPRYDNIYDPRFTGYGTSYRNYVDTVTGQPRFPYDDVNAVRMPNYIVRSKIDTHNFADKYDSMQNSGISLNDIRSKVQDAFLQDNLIHRDEMMSRLMRKRNSEMWQVRQAPKYTM